MSAAACQYAFFITFLLLVNSGHALCHTKGIRPGRHPGSRYQGNATQTRMIEQQFLRWVRFVGGLRHTVFGAAMNRLFPSYTLTVDKNPAAGDFTTVQSAIDSVPFVNLLRVVIRVNPGVYTEKVTISPLRAFLTIEGAGAERTIIQWGDTAQTPGPNGQPMGTFNSATFAVNAPYFIAKNITFKNTTPVPPPGALGKQAVALRISADTASFWGCKFLGAQDTLYDHLGRHYYKDCYIEGSVDFIFGNGLSLFEVLRLHKTQPNINKVFGTNRVSCRHPLVSTRYISFRHFNIQSLLSPGRGSECD